ncbi:MAG TPA: hypothetical protein VL126_07375 [Bacteroidota bacterium]|nr:hypothetical protein [Bacteroidota bacterium]
MRLVLSVGMHDADYVDAYYGPDQLKKEATEEKLSLESIRRAAAAAVAELKTLSPTRMDELVSLRRQYILRQLQALISRVDMLAGKKLKFDEESEALYDAVAPAHSEDHFRGILDELSALLPGKGEVPARFEAYRKDFTIPKQKLDSVFKAAVEESRKRTRAHIALPEQESFEVEYVTGKSWSGYNWYKGGCHSLIQVNTDFPITIDRAIDLASHEGYPGHHVYNCLLETNFVRARKWWEFSVYPLFSPQSLIAEGTANYGIEVAFPGAERVHFEQEVLFPRAGLDGAKAEQYYHIHALFLKLAYAGNEAARGYLDGELTREQAADWLVKYALMSAERAAQRTRFFDQYRSYVINYNLGQDMVKRYIESRGGTPERPERRWREFEQLISSPRLPSALLGRERRKESSGDILSRA